MAFIIICAAVGGMVTTMHEFAKAEKQPKEQENPFISQLMGNMYPGIALFARDVNLLPGLAEKYKEGMIIREKGFTDATIRFGGMATSHRYVILSNHMKSFAMLENGTNWGLHVANKDAHFKVLGQVDYKGKTGIFLLHLPDDGTWKAYQTMEFSLDKELYEKAVLRFQAKALDAPIPELAAREWLERCQFPVGMSDDGQFWPLEELPKQWQDPEMPIYPSVFVKGDEGQRIHYYQDSVYGTLFKSIREEADYVGRWYQLDSAAKVWLENGAAGSEYEWGSLPHVQEVFVASDSYEMGIDLREGGIIHTEFYAGRGADCQIQLKGSRVSRRHVCFYYDGIHWLIRDLKSTNGVELNGKKVGASVLKKGDQLSLGDAQILFQGSFLQVTDAAGKRTLCFPKEMLLRGALERKRKSRYRGCLLGGAVGDALGYPVEFMREDGIFRKYGEKGIQTLSQAGNPAVISDDTQMTLFAANALIRSASIHCDWKENLLRAYQEWLGTQGDECCIRNDPRPRMWLYEVEDLHARRAPGNTCLASIRRTAGKREAVLADNNSKGCGTVMRAAPYGLSVGYDPVYSRGDDTYAVTRMARVDAELTHGHPAAREASTLLANLIWEIVQYRQQRCDPLEEAVRCSCGSSGLLKKAVALALDRNVPDLDGIHQLGEGWVGDEALAIAVFCAVRYQNDFAAGIRAAVNHKGDSDSTGAICGNILGAWLGEEAVEKAFDLKLLELADVTRTIADDLYRSEQGLVPEPGKDREWDWKYRRK